MATEGLYKWSDSDQPYNNGFSLRSVNYAIPHPRDTRVPAGAPFTKGSLLSIIPEQRYNCNNQKQNIYAELYPRHRLAQLTPDLAAEHT